jgi:energy-converting hydrogenase Eha subunit H
VLLIVVKLEGMLDSASSIVLLLVLLTIAVNTSAGEAANSPFYSLKESMYESITDRGDAVD